MDFIVQEVGREHKMIQNHVSNERRPYAHRIIVMHRLLSFNTTLTYLTFSTKFLYAKVFQIHVLLWCDGLHFVGDEMDHIGSYISYVLLQWDHDDSTSASIDGDS